MLKGADRVRLRPGVIFGSNDIDGCSHAVFEILANSIDEAREGYGSVITLTRFRDKSIEITDMGRGIPLDFNTKENRFNWELVYCELYAGGKYNTLDAQNYEYSLGLNGLGCCATQYASEWMDVTVYRDGTKFSLHFEHGENVGGLQKEPTNRRQTGTITRFKPDLAVFTDIDIPLEYIKTVMKKQAVANGGIKFVLKNELEKGFEEFEYLYPNGISDYITEIIGEDTPISQPYFCKTERRGKDRADLPEYKVKIEANFCFTNKASLAEYYHNSSYLEHGGSPDKATRTALVYAVDNLIKNLGKYNKNESKITFQDVLDCLVLVINSSSTQTSYENQTKKAITNKFIQEAITDFLKQQLEIFFIENKPEAERIADQVLVNKRSRETAEKSRVDIKKQLTGKISIANRVKNFVDCRSKDVQQREIFIVEGNSALGSCIQARDPSFQAIIPVRGKILNCVKEDLPRIFKSEIITDLLKVLGCGVEVKGKTAKEIDSFDIEKLRFGKIIICTDADVDGFHIRTLILAMIYRLIPTLITMGKVYIAESPLFEINTKTDTYFAYTEKEKVEILEKLGDKKYTIQRSKGLGENEPKMMSLTTMSPATRRLIQVAPEDAALLDQYFDLLLGDNLEGRKTYIAENGAQYIELADIS